MSNSRNKNIGGVVGFLIVLCIAIAANVILSNVRIRKDITEEQLYVLSDGTKDVLKTLESDVVLTFFFNRSNPQVPVYIKGFARRIEDLLKEYEIASKGKITIQKMDPKQDSDAEEKAQEYGLSGQPMGFMGPTLYMGLVATANESEDIIPFVDMRTENLLEYNITRMVLRVAKPKKPVIGVISGLPVLGDRRPPYPMPNMPPPAPAWIVFDELKKDYEVREVKTPTGMIDEDIDTLLVVHPKGLKDQTVYAIDQFVLGGGRLIAFLDPMSLVEGATKPASPQTRFQPKSSDLPKLLSAWGVKYDSSKTVVDMESPTQIPTAQNRVENNPLWLSLRKRNFDEEDILTSQIERMLLPFSGSFEAESTKDVKVTTLIASSQTSALVDGMKAQFGVDGIRRDFKSGLKKLKLAIRLHGKLKTAFPGGPPAPEGDSSPVLSGGLKESQDTSTVILIGDTDMLYDNFCVQKIPVPGYSAYAPINDNLPLLANMVEQMAGGAALVSIRTRGKTERPFEVVLDIERKAQERHRDEEMALQKKLEDAQRRLSQLESKRDKKQRVFVSPEQQKEIKAFRAEMAETRKKLKVVRRSLREDIERLGVRVKVINIVLMPLLVTIIGVGFWLYRRRKMGA